MFVIKDWIRLFSIQRNSRAVILTILIITCNAVNGQFGEYSTRSGQSGGSNTGGVYLGFYGGSGSSPVPSVSGRSSSGSSGSGSGNIIIPIGVSRHHPIEFRQYKIPTVESMNAKPRTFEVEGGQTPLTLYFGSRSSDIRVVGDSNGRYGDSGPSKSIHEPQVTYYEVNKPIFEEVHQTIQCVFSDKQPYGEGSYDEIPVPSYGRSDRRYNQMC